MDKAKLEEYQEIISCLDGDLRTDYSGRGMYGKLCYGVVTSRPIAVIEEAASQGLRGAQMDSMGLETIVYWPRVEGEREIEGEDEDEDE